MGDVTQKVSTGSLPGWAEVNALIHDAHERYRDEDEGLVAYYIPALGQADPDHFGLSVVETNGAVHEVGDAAVTFSIQSISKAFVYALVCEAYGHDVVRDRVGVNNTGLSFNSVMALELNDGHPMNPMVNAGALATTALLPGDDPGEQWELVHRGLSRFAGRRLELDEEVYRSESETNMRNRALAQLLRSYGRLDQDPQAVVDIYTRQCSLSVTARDLAVMGATLADFTVTVGAYASGVTPVALSLTSGQTTALTADADLDGLEEFVFDILWTPSGGTQQRLMGGIIKISGKVTA